MSYFQTDIPSVVAEYYVDKADAGKFVAFWTVPNTVPIASTQVAIKGIVQYSTRAQFSVEQLATRHSQEHMLSAVGPDAQGE